MSEDGAITEKWWNILEKNRENITTLVMQYGRKYNVDNFDNAISTKNHYVMNILLNEVWFNAPDNRNIYKVAGFMAMCDLLDGTWENYTDDSKEPPF